MKKERRKGKERKGRGTAGAKGPLQPIISKTKSRRNVMLIDNEIL